MVKEEQEDMEQEPAAVAGTAAEEAHGIIHPTVEAEDQDM